MFIVLWSEFKRRGKRSSPSQKNKMYDADLLNSFCLLHHLHLLVLVMLNTLPVRYAIHLYLYI